MGAGRGVPRENGYSRPLIRSRKSLQDKPRREEGQGGLAAACFAGGARWPVSSPRTSGRHGGEGAVHRVGEPFGQGPGAHVTQTSAGGRRQKKKYIKVTWNQWERGPSLGLELAKGCCLASGAQRHAFFDLRSRLFLFF